MLLAVALLLLSGHPRKVDHFADLHSGAVMKIDYHDDGCFHGNHYAFTFEAGLRPTLDTTNMLEPVSKLFHVGVINLSRDEIHGMDMAMDRLRSLKSVGCTTVKRSIYTELINGKVVAAETLIDDTCSDDSALDAKGILSFDRLFHRAKALN